MERLKEYIRTGGTAAAPDTAALDRLLERYPWFTAARIVRAHVTDGADETLPAYAGAASSLRMRQVDTSVFDGITEEEIIDRFLHLDDYRIVASDTDESAPAEEITTEAQLDDEDDLVSEELAEIYAAQGLKKEAAEIYGKLSLRNTEKSVYFAEKIRKLETNN